ncbi:FliH/SctL family protein [Sphingomonas trueperi]|uniref:Flagellar assembly protein FliH n=1 Tax=Sphingomonas trueperi TaxID=53317 RepID=A0A7X5Y4T3_9SPHN|nr:FliH/SctL family protein [Sphingomonas trueperi]NJB99471.1 flagellar biosynthesis/type III secretory pathway protein FliH [Sphingomonas trueperi]
MTYHLVQADDSALLFSERAVIKRGERQSFAAAVALLGAVREAQARAVQAANAAREEAYSTALDGARAEIDSLLAGEIARFSRAIDLEEQTRRAEIAEAALAAVRAVLGELDNATLVPALVARALDRLQPQGAVIVAVAPDLADKVAERLEALTEVSILPDPALGAHDCAIRTEQGQVIASLSVQLETLAKRWGVA